jgi:hypothetical protein
MLRVCHSRRPFSDFSWDVETSPRYVASFDCVRTSTVSTTTSPNSKKFRRYLTAHSGARGIKEIQSAGDPIECWMDRNAMLHVGWQETQDDTVFFWHFQSLLLLLVFVKLSRAAERRSPSSTRGSMDDIAQILWGSGDSSSDVIFLYINIYWNFDFFLLVFFLCWMFIPFGNVRGTCCCTGTIFIIESSAQIAEGKNTTRPSIFEWMNDDPSPTPISEWWSCPTSPRRKCIRDRVC